MAKPKPSTTQTGANDIAAKAKPFLERIERLLAEKKEFADGIASDIKEIYAEAEEHGIQPKVLKRIVRMRKLEADLAGLPAKLDIDEAAQFRALADAFAGTPFGEHASARAELAAMAKRLADDGTTMTVTLGHEALRADEEHLSRIGRGDVIDELTER